jgi:predicted amidohydrolase
VARNVRPEETYRFDVLYKPENVEKEDVSIAAILSWCSDDHGKKPVQRDYADGVPEDGEWRRINRTLQAPKDAHSVQIELALRWTENGSVLWKNPQLVGVKPSAHRTIRVVTTHVKPSYPATVEKNLKLMSEILDKAGAEKPDIVCLSENFVDRGVSLPLIETVQTISGPATNMLCEKAKQYNTYVVTTLHELQGDFIYNTAVLINRKGEIVGKYRKVHLATAEGENGVTPGSEYPVFDTDFGRIGILTCWDNWFVEPARILRLKGAEMLLFPCAGDGTPRHYDVIWRARAIDNGVYFVSSTTVGDAPSRIIDPTGEVLAETAEPFGIAVAEIDLGKEWRVYWLSVGPSYGEAKSLYIKERRPDTYGIFTEDVIERGK